MLAKIISGGQSGADEGGLMAAAALGIPTGGWMPRGFLREAESGRFHYSDPALAERYGLREHPDDGYPPRTEENMRAADGTVYFLRGPTSRGWMLTTKINRTLLKPLLRVDLREARFGTSGFRPWLYTNRIAVLNVAGGRQSQNPGIHSEVRDYLIEALEAIGHRRIA